MADGKQAGGSYPVVLYVYDLSKGMAKMMSQQLVGMQVDGIWHTGIVTHGYEYFYGGGIQSSLPECNQAGQAVQKIALGFTQKTQEELHTFLRRIASEWTKEKYHLLQHNCNNFSDTVSKFLLGKPIPSFITGLPSQVLSTPLGSMIAGYYENMAKQQTDSFVPSGSGDLNLPPIGGGANMGGMTATGSGSSTQNDDVNVSMGLGSKDTAGRLIRKVWNENDTKSATKALNLLRKILANIVKKPEEAKFRKLKVSVLDMRLGTVEGGGELLKEIGFARNETKTHYILPLEKVSTLPAVVAKIEARVEKTSTEKQPKQLGKR